MATANVPRTVTFGPLYSGQASNLVYTVLDSGGTTRIGPTTGTGVAEMLDAIGNATTGSYAVTLAIDPAWLPCTEKYQIAGKAGVGVQGTFGLEAMPTSIDNTGKVVLQNASIASATFATGATVPVVASVTAVADKTGYSLTSSEHTAIQSDVSTATAAFWSSPATFRSQDNVGTPTREDCLAGAWTTAFAAWTDNSAAIPPQLVQYLPGGPGFGTIRIYSLALNSNGQPVARS